MTGPRPAQHLVHGIDGPVVIVSARVCAYLGRHADLDTFRSTHRGTDREVDEALLAMRVAAMSWKKTATGTTEAPVAELDPSLQWLSTSTAAGLAGITDRGIRKAIAEKQLKATSIDGRWRIRRDDFEHWKAARVA